MQRIPVVFATCSELPDLTDDDRLVMAPAAALGLTVHSVCWDDPEFDWAGPALIAIRSTWDYSDRVEEYRAWLRRCDRLGARLFNSPANVEWNLDKHYLKEFGDRVVPTRWIRFESPEALRKAIETSGWNEVVVKPTVSVGAKLTHRLKAGQKKLPSYPLGIALMLQPFLPEIISRGEWSLLYFDGELSHTALKLPKANDFRVQTIHGGTLTKLPPPEEARRLAEEVLRIAPSDLLYARVDLVETSEGFRLMELEINEPAIYFELDPKAPEKFARALVKYARR